MLAHTARHIETRFRRTKASDSSSDDHGYILRDFDISLMELDLLNRTAHAKGRSYVIGMFQDGAEYVECLFSQSPEGQRSKCHPRG